MRRWTLYRASGRSCGESVFSAFYVVRCAPSDGRLLLRALGRQMKRFEPRTVAKLGLVGFHIQLHSGRRSGRSRQIRSLPGNGFRRLDRLASITAFLTLNDNPRMKPLPLWYAEELRQDAA